MKNIFKSLAGLFVLLLVLILPAHAQFVFGIGGQLAAYNGPILSINQAGIGYAPGAGGAVTQATNRTTGVTVNKVSGAITTNGASLATGASATFTVTDSSVAIGDVVVISQRSGAVNVDTVVQVTAVAAGSFNVTVYNADATTAETGAIVINFAVIKAVSS